MARPLRVARSVAAVAVTMLVLDLTWIGVVAKPVYAKLGPLQRDSPLVAAAAVFYVMYVTVTFLHAVRPAASPRAAAARGAGLGFVAYATYELTNLAILRDWPMVVVPIDVLWGTVLTAITAAAGRLALGSNE